MAAPRRPRAVSRVLASLLQNDIPVFCPALTDGSIGDMMYFHSFKNPGLVLVRALRAVGSGAGCGR